MTKAAPLGAPPRRTTRRVLLAICLAIIGCLVVRERSTFYTLLIFVSSRSAALAHERLIEIEPTVTAYGLLERAARRSDVEGVLAESVLLHHQSGRSPTGIKTVYFEDLQIWIRCRLPDGDTTEKSAREGED